MNLQRARRADHVDNLQAGRAANDGVVDQNNALSLDSRSVGVVLQLHAKVPYVVRRLDKGTAHIVVANDAQFEGKARLFPRNRWPRAIRCPEREQPCRPRRRFPGPVERRFSSDVVNVQAFDHAVRTGEVDIRKRKTAMTVSKGLNELRPESSMTIRFARFHVADKSRPDDIERAGFRGDDPGVVELPKNQGSNAEGIAHADQFFAGQRNDGIGPLDLAHGVDETVHHGVA